MIKKIKFKDVKLKRQQKHGFKNASYYSKNITQHLKNNLLKMMGLKLLVLGLKLVELFHQFSEK